MKKVECNEAAGYPEPDIQDAQVLSAWVSYRWYRAKDRAFVACHYLGCARGPRPKRGADLAHAHVVRTNFYASTRFEILAVRDNKVRYYGILLPVCPERTSVLVGFHAVSVHQAAPLLDDRVLWVPQPKAVCPVSKDVAFSVSIKYRRESWDTRIKGHSHGAV